MAGYIERVFPIRIQIDPLQEKLRLKQASQFGPELYGYKRVERHRCEDEPSNRGPTSIQAFGALFALRPKNRQYEVFAVSENVYEIIGRSVDAIFVLGCFCDVIVDAEKADFRRRLESLLYVDIEADSSGVTDIFPVSISSASGLVTEHWCTVRKVKEPENAIICELEPHSSPWHSKTKDSALPAKPVKTLNYKPSVEEWRGSTSRRSKPLHTFRGAHHTDNIPSTNLITAWNEIQSQLVTSSSMEELFGVVVGTVSELTGFDRVMLYRFDECKGGAVVAEYVNPLVSEDLFIGLHFPSSDLPSYTRDLLKENRVQVLRDRTAQNVTLVFRSNCSPKSLDLRGAYLQDINPDQVRFFSELGVCSALTIPVVVENDLWGLITCHTYSKRIMEVSPPLRAICESIGRCASSQVARLLDAERLKARALLASDLSQKSPSAIIASFSNNLLQTFAAEFGMLVLSDEARPVGKLESYQEALALVQYFRTVGVSSVIASQKISADFPDLSYAPGFSLVAGVLFIPLSRSGSDFLILFRKEQLMEVHWAGNGEERFESIGPGNAEPNSFQRWVDHVTNTSREWTTCQLEMASILSTLYGTFTEVWSKRQRSIGKNRMRQLLISNASHDVRTPLSQIISNLEVAMDSINMTEGAYEHVKSSLIASKSLIYVINDILSLTKAEQGFPSQTQQIFSPQSLLLEVLGAFATAAETKGVRISFDCGALALPEMAAENPPLLRQAVSNILSNAIEHSAHGTIAVQAYIHYATAGSIPGTYLDITVKDDGKGMSEEQLDNLFRQFENILDDEDASDGEGKESIGLGLAVVARFVSKNKGQMRMRTKEGTGTQVSISIPVKIESGDLLRSESPLTPSTDGQDTSSQTGKAGTYPKNGVPNSPKSLRGILKKPKVTAPATPPSQLIDPEDLSAPLDAYPFPTIDEVATPDKKVKLRILVAEDNPLNAQVLRVQMTKMGHDVTIVGDGQQCFDKFRENRKFFDIILMDFQMPLVDGPASTKLIRQFESTASPPLSSQAQSRGRIPILALSASLEEKNRNEYLQVGFDGWILKPMDIRRLDAFMGGIWDATVRKAYTYEDGMWESGGWFKVI